MAYILSIDEGTTGVRGMIVDEHGAVLGWGYTEFAQVYPQPGWVSHDAVAIWDATLDACGRAFDAAGITAADLTCIGITNQRETTVVWDRSSLQPIDLAIVWQCRRTADVCDALAAAGHGERVRETTGLVLDAYFSGTKAAWLLDNNDGARADADAGRLAFGTIDSWLIAKLTGGTAHVTEPSNASRTMLFDVRRGGWSDEMADLLHVPQAVLPEVLDSSGTFGITDPDAFFGASVPITGVAGDQQAALFGQGCWRAGTSKNTYGTGSFLLLNTGTTATMSERGVLTSVGWRIGGETTFVLEGAIFVTGAAVQWLRDEIGIISAAEESEALAAPIPPGNEGVYLVPAFVGLGAPHWDPHARGLLIGLTRGTRRAHLARAALEAMAYQSADVADLVCAESGQRIDELRVDGGAVSNDLLCQFQADVMGVPVVRPKVRETTAMGAAYLAGLGAGVWASTDELESAWQLDRRFEPTMDAPTRHRLRAGWSEAVRRSLGWATHGV